MKRQNKPIPIPADLFERFRERCKRDQVSMSKRLEQLLADLPATFEERAN